MDMKSFYANEKPKTKRKGFFISRNDGGYAFDCCCFSGISTDDN